MPERHGSWDSFPQYIRWSRPPSFYARQADRVPRCPPQGAPAAMRASSQVSSPEAEPADLLKRLWHRLRALGPAEWLKSMRFLHSQSNPDPAWLTTAQPAASTRA